MKKWLVRLNPAWHLLVAVSLCALSLGVPAPVRVYAAVLGTRALPAGTVAPGQQFNVTVTFSAPASNFLAIALGDSAPTGWAVATDTTWVTPNPMDTLVTANRAEYIWSGPYAQGTSFTVLYKVTVPAGAASGTYNFTSGNIEYYLDGVNAIVDTIGGNSQVTVADPTAKAITAFNFTTPSVNGVITESSHTIAVTVPFGTDRSSLTPTTITITGASISPQANVAQNFTSPVSYTVTAADSSTQIYVVTVTVAPNTAAEILTYSLPGQTGSATLGNGTIAVTVPFGTNVSALAATFTLSNGAAATVGSTAQVSGTTPNNFGSPVTYVVTAASGATKNWVVTVTVSANTAAEILTYSLPGQTGSATLGNGTIGVTVPFGTNVSALVATFTLSSGASAAVGSTAQVSGTTANNFSTPVTYVVTAASGATKNWVVTVTVAPNTAAEILTYSLPGQTGSATLGNGTIAVTVPFGTNVSALAASFTLSSGASAVVGSTTQVSGTTPNNFGSPVTYVVTAASGATKNWVVTVTVGLNPAKAITAFNFNGVTPAVVGVINEPNHTVALTVPLGINVTNLVPTITVSTGASVSPLSGVAHDFGTPATYTVTAADGTTQVYVVTVTIGPKALTTITITPSAPTTIPKGSSQQFSVSGTYSDGSSDNPLPGVVWNSSNPGVSTISPAGLAAGLAVGATNITATKSGITSNIAVLNVATVDIVLIPSVQTATTQTTFDVTIQAQAGALPTAGVAVYLNFDPLKLAVVDMDANKSGIQITPGATLLTVLENTVDNTSGQINYSAGVLLPVPLADPTFPTGNITVATIRFMALTVTSPTTVVTFSTSPIRETKVTDSKGTNMAGTLTVGNYTILSGVDVTINIGLQGASRPDAGWAIPVTVKFFAPGADVLTAQPTYTYQVTTVKVNSTTASVICPAVTVGNYDISVVSGHTLLNVKRNIAVTLAMSAVSLGTLLEGDANADGTIDILDFGILSGSYNKSSGNSGYDARANFDRSDTVDILDFGLLSGNYKKTSPITVP